MCVTDTLTEDKIKSALEALARANQAFTKLADMADRQASDGFTEMRPLADDCRKLAHEMDVAAGGLSK